MRDDHAEEKADDTALLEPKSSEDDSGTVKSVSFVEPVTDKLYK